MNRIKQGIIGKSIWRRRRRQKEVTADNNKIEGKNKKELSSLQMFAVIASIIIILIALGGLGLVFNVFAQAT
ncbi:MAG: hypothetical protein GEU26_08425 [Nitrososphaeraceae archaeon]|nr:hypothetical protein [Nitrososphaeraceae archaeon]